MALPGSGSLSIKNSAGAGRSIAQEIDGNITGNKSLTTLSIAAGKTAPHGMLEFYNYSSSVSTSVFLNSGSVTTSTSGIVFRQSARTFTIGFTNNGLFAGGTFGLQIERYVFAQSNQVGGVGSAYVQRASPSPVNTITASGPFGMGAQSSTVYDNYSVQSGTIISYTMQVSELGNNISVNAQTSVRINSVWVENTVNPSIGSPSLLTLSA